MIGKTFSKLSEEEALVEYIIPTVLNDTLQEYIWNQDDAGNHVSINELWNLLTNNVYMHRLREKPVLINCIRQGVEQGLFGYATDYDGERYNGFVIGEVISDSTPLVAERNIGFIVRPNTATLQKEQTHTPAHPDNETNDPNEQKKDEETPETIEPTPPQGPRRITARKTIGEKILFGRNHHPSRKYYPKS